MIRLTATFVLAAGLSVAAQQSAPPRAWGGEPTGPPLFDAFDKSTITIAPVGAPPAALGLDPFYRKYVDAGGIPVVSSEHVQDAALVMAMNIVNYMLSKRPDIRAVMVERKSRLLVMARTEGEMDLPERRSWTKPAFDDRRLTDGERSRYYQPGGIDSMTAEQYWNNRARGMGGNVTSCGEENLLGYPGTRYYGEHITVHEFSHNIMSALRTADPALFAGIQPAYEQAKAKGLYKDSRGNAQYAINTAAEYWAEGTQWWFWSNIEFYDGTTKQRVQTPDEFKAYDPALYAILDKVYAGHHVPADLYYGKNLRPVPPPSARQDQPPRYRDPTASVDDRVRDLLSRMTLEEKFWQLFMIPGDLDTPANDYSHGIFGLQIGMAGRAPGAPTLTPAAAGRAHAERINAIQKYFVEQTRLGIPILPFEEAVHGITRDGGTMFPAAIALAATFDTTLMTRVATAIAEEAGSRGIRDVLSPVINVADDVRWGRVEETYGEDPYLSSEMGRAFVATFERMGIVTTPKHFIANVGEGGRDSYPIDHSERMLMERYYPPFVAALSAGARSVMAAYNSVDGLPATQNRHLLTDVLKRDWAFKGFVISDASGTSGAAVLHMTEASTATAAQHAFNSGLDVVFQSSYGQQRPYLDAFQRGLIPVPVIDEAVSRVLRMKFEIGLFEHPYVDVARAAALNGNADHRALAREAARSSIVLLKNDAKILPLPKTTKSVAVIGVDADEARLGGYSGAGNDKVSILAGIKRALGPGATVRYAAGPGRVVREFDIVPASQLSSTANGQTVRGLTGEYFDNPRLEGAPRLTRTDARMDFRWTLNSPGRGIPFDWYSVRWTGTLTAPAGGVKRIGVEGNDGYRLYLDDRLVVDNWLKRSFGTRVTDVTIAPGSTHAIRLEYFEATGNARVKLIWDAGIVDTSQAAIAAAVAAAKLSDAAIVVAGVEEGEFRDRAMLGLPGRQDALIRAIAATGKPTIVALVGGSAITMPWLDRAGAVIDVWYPGEAGGDAVADVLFGDANPAGRLPVTFPVFEGQLPLSYNHKPTGRGDDYVDLTGQPLFPFGFGLSYTTFEYSDLAIDSVEMGPSATATIRCAVKNTGARAGDEVVQLYVRDILGSVARPVMELKGFQRIRLAPGERKELTFTIGPNELRMLDEHMKWIVEPGAFRIMIGASSKDIRLRGQIVVK